jgi:hypothetical protein
MHNVMKHCQTMYHKDHLRFPFFELSAVEGFLIPLPSLNFLTPSFIRFASSGQPTIILSLCRLFLWVIKITSFFSIFSAGPKGHATEISFDTRCQ